MTALASASLSPPYSHACAMDMDLDLLEEERSPRHLRNFLMAYARDLPVTHVEPNKHAAYGKELYKRFEESYYRLKSQMGNLQTKLVFHGTRSENIGSILHFGLDDARRGIHGQVHGKGEYFAEKAKDSMIYCRGGTQMLVFAILVDESAKPERNPKRHCDSRAMGIYVVNNLGFQLPLFTLTFPSPHITIQYQVDGTGIAEAPLAYRSWRRWALAQNRHAHDQGVQHHVNGVAKLLRDRELIKHGAVKFKGVPPRLTQEYTFYATQEDVWSCANQMLQRMSLVNLPATYNPTSFKQLNAEICSRAPGMMYTADEFQVQMVGLIGPDLWTKLHGEMLEKLLHEAMPTIKMEPFPPEHEIPREIPEFFKAVELQIEAEDRAREEERRCRAEEELAAREQERAEEEARAKTEAETAAKAKVDAAVAASTEAAGVVAAVAQAAATPAQTAAEEREQAAIAAAAESSAPIAPETYPVRCPRCTTTMSVVMPPEKMRQTVRCISCKTLFCAQKPGAPLVSRADPENVVQAPLPCE